MICPLLLLTATGFRKAHMRACYSIRDKNYRYAVACRKTAETDITDG